MLNFFKSFFFEKKSEVNQISNGYRSRRNRGNVFEGEKKSGALNYPTAYRVDRYRLVQLSKKIFEESTQARSAIIRLNDSVVNTGLMLESTPDAEILGISEEQKISISNIIEKRFNLWANDPLKWCDFQRNNNFGQIERILFYNQLVKGDYFVLLMFSDDPRLINPLQLLVIDPETVCNTNDPVQKEAVKQRGHDMKGGIEFDGFGRQVAIFVKYKDRKTFQYKWQRIGVFNPVTGRRVVIHGNKQRFGNEPRGIPVLANVAHELEKVTDYSVYELAAALANATIAAIVEPSDEAPATNPFTNNSFVPPNILKKNGMWDDNTSDEANLDPGYTNIGKNVMKNSGGLLISSLNKGEKFTSHDTKRPNVNYGAFVDQVSTYVSSSLGIPIEVLKMVFGNNFSASRASLKLFWQSVNVWRDDIISDLRRPVHSAWLLGEVGTGNTILPGYDNPMLRPAWESANYIGIPSPSIDPVKEAKGAEIRVREGINTREQEQQKAGNRSGYESTIKRLKNENKQLAEAKEPLNEQEQMQGVA